MKSIKNIDIVLLTLISLNNNYNVMSTPNTLLQIRKYKEQLYIYHILHHFKILLKSGAEINIS